MLFNIYFFVPIFRSSPNGFTTMSCLCTVLCCKRRIVVSALPEIGRYGNCCIVIFGLSCIRKTYTWREPQSSFSCKVWISVRISWNLVDFMNPTDFMPEIWWISCLKALNQITKNFTFNTGQGEAMSFELCEICRISWNPLNFTWNWWISCLKPFKSDNSRKTLHFHRVHRRLCHMKSEIWQISPEIYFMKSKRILLKAREFHKISWNQQDLTQFHKSNTILL